MQQSRLKKLVPLQEVAVVTRLVDTYTKYKLQHPLKHGKDGGGEFFSFNIVIGRGRCITFFTIPKEFNEIANCVCRGTRFEFAAGI